MGLIKKTELFILYSELPIPVQKQTPKLYYLQQEESGGA